MRVIDISLPDETDDQGVHCVGAWPKGITVGNWREGGCAAHSLIHSCMHLTRCDVVFLFLLFFNFMFQSCSLCE